MRVYGERRLSHHGLSFAEQLVVMHLAAEGTSTQNDISKYFGLDKGTVAKTVAKLEARAFIERRTDPQDLRSKILTLTDKGKNLLHEMQEVSDKLHEGMFAGMTPDEVAATEAGLATMAKNIFEMTER